MKPLCKYFGFGHTLKLLRFPNKKDNRMKYQCVKCKEIVYSEPEKPTSTVHSLLSGGDLETQNFQL